MRKPKGEVRSSLSKNHFVCRAESGTVKGERLAPTGRNGFALRFCIKSKTFLGFLAAGATASARGNCSLFKTALEVEENELDEGRWVT